MNGFITLTTAGILEAEADFAIVGISSYIRNPQDPNAGSLLTEVSGAVTPVKETVSEIRALIEAEKGTS